VTVAVTADEALLGLKVAFLVLLYVFVWLVVRTATRGITAAPQESIVLSAQEAGALRAAVAAPARRLLVLSSPVLQPGAVVEVTAETGIGRGAENGVRLDGDTTVSGRHATVTSRTDGLWVADAGSTNGTFVNGARVTSPRLLQAGDVIRVGHTDLAVEP
jgi:pSer/pThr/pTyr-binding forkhead associated (FHA) protein